MLWSAIDFVRATVDDELGDASLGVARFEVDEASCLEAAGAAAPPKTAAGRGAVAAGSAVLIFVSNEL